MTDGSNVTNSDNDVMSDPTEMETSAPLEPMSPDDQQANELPMDEPLSELQEAKILLRELEELSEKRTSPRLDPNVAAGRPTYQSSVHGSGTPGRAVDGGRRTHWAHNSCTHTQTENNPWWYVDLGKTVTVDHVAILNRLDCCTDRITPLDVHVGQSREVTRNARCGGHHRFPIGQSELTVNCNGRRGRYVGIRLPGNHRILTLCEVEVYAAPNRALGRPAVQSSVGWSGFPIRAVDGCRDSNYNQHCCTHTQAQTNPYWYVDLGSQKRVQWVVITDRRDCCSERLSPFTIHIGNSPNVASNPRCGGHHTIPAGKDKDVVNCNGMRGRYVGIRLPGNGRFLTLCEVEVYEGSGYRKRTSDVRGIDVQGCGEHKEGDSWVSDEDNCICDLNEEVCYKVDCGQDGKQQPTKGQDGLWSCPEMPDATSEESEPEIPDGDMESAVDDLQT
ncbi:Hypp3069 [Branchiostoma lanceolatum]|uniref:Hypp3069 protein n=1 Tax=Branchiostoma lanceolatum TaxID=7740 RepID=A0A8J9ZZK7_BRALA|nr:Hypp3069 [Branchiostoma lanceolatum]